MSFKPDGWHSLTVRIFTHDPQGLIGFLRDVFGATGEYRQDAPAEMWIGDSVLMVSSGREPMGAFLYVYVPDADAVHRRAVAAGAESVEAPGDTFYGDRRGTVRDAWGNIWQIATRLSS